MVAQFWSLVDKSGSCWLWVGKLTYQGYGTFRFKRLTVRAHRLAYQLVRGRIPTNDEAGYIVTIDHICRVRKCVNPDHLQIVSGSENTLRGIAPSAINARKTHCKRGHPFDAANTLVRPEGRYCRACRRDAERRRYHAGRRTGSRCRER